MSFSSPTLKERLQAVKKTRWIRFGVAAVLFILFAVWLDNYYILPLLIVMADIYLTLAPDNTLPLTLSADAALNLSVTLRSIEVQRFAQRERSITLNRSAALRLPSTHGVGQNFLIRKEGFTRK